MVSDVRTVVPVGGDTVSTDLVKSPRHLYVYQIITHTLTFHSVIGQLYLNSLRKNIKSSDDAGCRRKQPPVSLMGTVSVDTFAYFRVFGKRFNFIMLSDNGAPPPLPATLHSNLAPHLRPLIALFWTPFVLVPPGRPDLCSISAWTPTLPPCPLPLFPGISLHQRPLPQKGSAVCLFTNTG